MKICWFILYSKVYFIKVNFTRKGLIFIWYFWSYNANRMFYFRCNFDMFIENGTFLIFLHLFKIQKPPIRIKRSKEVDNINIDSFPVILAQTKNFNKKKFVFLTVININFNTTLNF